MNRKPRHIVIVGGGTSGAVLAARLSENQDIEVTLLEAGGDHDAYAATMKEPARAAEIWTEASSLAITPMLTEARPIPMVQGRILGGTSAINGLATLRGLPGDYDQWAAAGLEGWAWDDVADTFIAAESDADFPASPLHGHDGPLPVRRWRREEISRAQLAYLDGMVETGNPAVTDVNDPSQLPGVGIFPVTIDEHGNRVSTSLAYLTAAVRARDNLQVRTGAEVSRLAVNGDRVTGVTLATGEELTADEVVVSAGALWTPLLLMRSGIGPAAHLSEYGIEVHANLPVGETMSDHLGPGITYRHEGARGGVAGPAQVVLVGASNGKDVDYHAFPIAPGPSGGPTVFNMAVFLMRSSGRGSVKLGGTLDADPVITAPPLPADGFDRLRHAFDRLAQWERSAPARALGCEQIDSLDLNAPEAAAAAFERFPMSYAHMVGTCPMGAVLDADCRVLGLRGVRVADASVMPTIPSGNTYLGCVMVAERIARKMMAEAS